jgi:hypothetical protein
MTLIFMPVLGASAEKELHAVIDWSSWNDTLKAHASDGRLDYDGVAEAPGFTTTVEAVGGADLASAGPEEELAFLINSYNVLAVHGILEGRSPRTNLGKLRYFYRVKYLVAGEKLSLHALEKRHLRPLDEPRIHFAIVCASTSCPELRAEAYLPKVLDSQLDDAARTFINDVTKNRFDTDNEEAHLSKIFKWFAEDFEAAAGSVQSYLADYVEDEEAAAILREGRFKLRYLDYDWSLNGTFSGAKR